MRYFKERQLLALAIFVELAIALGLIILLPLMTFRADWIIPVGAAGCAIFSWFLSYVMASASTILSKSQPIHHQSRIQRSSSKVKFLIFSCCKLLLWINKKYSCCVGEKCYGLIESLDGKLAPSTRDWFYFSILDFMYGFWYDNNDLAISESRVDWKTGGKSTIRRSNKVIQYQIRCEWFWYRQWSFRFFWKFGKNFTEWFSNWIKSV